MNNFNEIIKQKLEQFEVPYNDAHWAEMESKLNSIRAAKIKRNILGGAGAIVVLAVSSYFIFTNNQTIQKNNETIVVTETGENIIENNFISNKKIENNAPIKIVPNNVAADEKIETKTIVEEATHKTIENKTIVEEATHKTMENKTIVEEKPSPTVNEVKTNNVSLTADFIVYNNQVCLGEDVGFESITKNLPVSYLWNFGDGTTSKKANPTHIFNESGKYAVTLSLTNRKTGIETSHTERNSVVIFPLPKADFSYSEISLNKDDNKLKYPYTEFYNKAIETTNFYTWNFGNGETATSPNPKTIYKKKGNYKIMLSVKNSYGCLKSITKNISIIQDYDLYAPNSFSPDGDGVNETFIPKALLGWDVQFEMIIIDKTTKVVYTTSDKNEPWNGRLNNDATEMEEGIYFWQVITHDANGNIHRQQDKVNLIR